MTKENQKKEWLYIIDSQKKGFSLGLRELRKNKYLMFLFFKRDFTAMYKQTVLGPAWYLIQPIFTTIVFAFIFGNLANMGTDNIPSYLFYLCGIIQWRLFSDTLTKTSKTFITNKNLFGKVYFPRLSVPISDLGSNLVAYLIQFLLFVLIYVYYLFNGLSFNVSVYALLFPLILIQLSLLGIGFGLLITSLTTKYRDLQFVVSFFMQLWMYASPVAYPLSELSGKIPEKIAWVFWLNPVSFPIEAFRYMVFGTNTLDLSQGVVSLALTIIILLVGLLTFNRVERDFMDRI